MIRRTNQEWLAALRGRDPDPAALSDLRAYIMRAALFTLQRARHHVGHLGPGALSALAEDCAQEAVAAILQSLDTFRGDSKFTTWVYTFAVNTALLAARRERWGSVSLDAILEGTETASSIDDRDVPADPERRALQAEAMGVVRECLETQLSARQQQLLRAVVFEGIPLDEIVRRWGSNRNALYKMLHDARRKLRSHLVARGLDVDEILDLFAMRT
jgi:RNA polymerase sigma-70 factor, ECF subfamily